MSIKKVLFLSIASTIALASAVAIISGCGGDKGTNPPGSKPTYTLTVNRSPTSGGTVDPATSKSNVIPGTAVDIKATPAAGYTFKSWTTSSSYASFADPGSPATKVTLSTSVTSNASVTVTANFEQIPAGKFSVSFNTDGGTPATIASIQVDSGRTIGSSLFPAAPQKAGHRFVGWFDGTTATAAQYTATAPIITKNVALTARWAEILPDEVSTFVVMFDVNGGTPLTIPPIEVDSGFTAGDDFPEDPTREDYGFGGWFEGTGTNWTVQFTDSTIVRRDVTVRARWLPIYTVIFQTNGGTPSAIDPLVVDSGSTMGEDYPAVTRMGYTFDGWYEGTGSSAYTATTRITKNVTLAARWTIKKFTLSFDPNGGTPVNINSITVDSGMTTALPAVTKPSNMFEGWYDGTTQYTAATVITKNAALVAKWTPVVGGTFTDPRDSKVYKWVEIGDQTWMAENLNYATADSSWCYDNDPINCGIYGRLYAWNIAKTACPTGWHLPTRAEWEILANSVGTTPGTKLKSTTGWSSGNGTDIYGFTALPGGYRDYSSSTTYQDLRTYTYWWSNTEYSTTATYAFYVYNSSSSMYYTSYGSNKRNGESVRCVKDAAK